ncbi:hypothetical protein BDV59DRAFT_95112 [Aspergillus ambiguus]|uniref:uncharacterized protein n=1 Tax=Aspergillus ambiguus TaxID=176160 RepID=UPI003CCD7F94
MLIPTTRGLALVHLAPLGFLQPEAAYTMDPRPSKLNRHVKNPNLCENEFNCLYYGSWICIIYPEYEILTIPLYFFNRH